MRPLPVLQRSAQMPPAVDPLWNVAWDDGGAGPFGEEEIPLADVRTILQVAGLAPSSGNLQPWRFVVVRSPGQRQALGDAMRYPLRVQSAPVVIVAFALRRSWRLLFCDESPVAASVPCKDAALVAWINRQVSVAITYMMVAAKALGWDVAPHERFNSSGVIGALDLPEDAEVVAVLALGRGTCDPALGERLPLDQIAALERWGARWTDSVEALI